jgi:hypothetical protein
MTARMITIAGARGGSGTTTVAAATALLLARHATTELVAAERDTTAALLGLTGPHDGCAPIKVAERLTLVSTPSGTAEIAVVDAQRLEQLDARPGGLFVVVLRGPCYLGLRTITTCGVRADGIVLLMEPGRSLTRRDVSDVCHVPVNRRDRRDRQRGPHNRRWTPRQPPRSTPRIQGPPPPPERPRDPS